MEFRCDTRRLVPLSAGNSPELLAYLDELSRQAGLARPPAWLVAPYNATVSGLAFGQVRRRCVQLDAGLVIQYTTDRAAFRAVESGAHVTARACRGRRPRT